MSCELELFFYCAANQSVAIDTESRINEFIEQIKSMFKQSLPVWEFKVVPSFLREFISQKGNKIQYSKLSMFKSIFQLQKTMKKLSKKSSQKKINNLQQRDKRLIVWIIMRFAQINLIQSFFELNREHYLEVSKILNISEEIIYNQISQLFIETMTDRPFSEEENANLINTIEQKQIKGSNEINWLSVCYDYNLNIQKKYQYCRSVKQLKHQYQNKLDFNLKQNKKWTFQEDLQLLQLSVKYEKSWSKINRDMMNTRNQTQIKNRYQSLINQYIKQNGIVSPSKETVKESLHYEKNLVKKIINSFQSRLHNIVYQEEEEEEEDREEISDCNQNEEKQTSSSYQQLSSPKSSSNKGRQQQQQQQSPLLQNVQQQNNEQQLQQNLLKKQKIISSLVLDNECQNLVQQNLFYEQMQEQFQQQQKYMNQNQFSLQSIQLDNFNNNNNNTDQSYQQLIEESLIFQQYKQFIHNFQNQQQQQSSFTNFDNEKIQYLGGPKQDNNFNIDQSLRPIMREDSITIYKEDKLLQLQQGNSYKQQQTHHYLNQVSNQKQQQQQMQTSFQHENNLLNNKNQNINSMVSYYQQQQQQPFQQMQQPPLLFQKVQQTPQQQQQLQAQQPINCQKQSLQTNQTNNYQYYLNNLGSLQQYQYQQQQQQQQQPIIDSNEQDSSENNTFAFYFLGVNQN